MDVHAKKAMHERKKAGEERRSAGGWIPPSILLIAAARAKDFSVRRTSPQSSHSLVRRGRQATWIHTTVKRRGVLRSEALRPVAAQSQERKVASGCVQICPMTRVAGTFYNTQGDGVATHRRLLQRGGSNPPGTWEDSGGAVGFLARYLHRFL
jgi:hypothetical protein